MLRLGITMTQLARILGVHKSDVSHALSPRAKRKRYIKLRQRIRATLKRLKHLRPQYGYDALCRLGYQCDRDYHADLMMLLQRAIDSRAPIPPISISLFAQSCLMHPSTFLKALRGDPKISPATRERAQRLWQLCLKEAYEDWILYPPYL